MRVLVFSDVHANLSALQAVLLEAEPFDAAWCLGDLVGYGPDPNEVITLVRSLPNLTCLQGNHDAAALNQIPLETFNREARLSIQWLRNNMLPENLVFLQSLDTLVVAGSVTLAHGSPRNPIWEYLLDSGSAEGNMDFIDTPWCFVGHTHLPLGYFRAQPNGRVERRMLQPGVSLQLSGQVVLNPGSVGQPRDHDPRAAYAIFDTETCVWESHRAVYDVASVQQRIFAAGLPFRHALRLSEGW
jgi:diadenosine tetraphosphatase ApaH/serine/threonine PP2A family protein phosphatase